MPNKNNSPRENAKPTGDMSAEESKEYAQQFQKENFGGSINVGGGSKNADSSATTRETIQRSAHKTEQQNDEANIKHKAGGDSETDKDLG